VTCCLIKHRNKFAFCPYFRKREYLSTVWVSHQYERRCKFFFLISVLFPNLLFLLLPIDVSISFFLEWLRNVCSRRWHKPNSVKFYKSKLATTRHKKLYCVPSSDV
jgi:hypothetical protein